MKKLLSLTLIIIMLFSTISINVSASTAPSDWAVNEVNNAKNAGIITNAVTKNYQKDITREEFCELVVKLYEKLTNQSATVGTDIFNDTDNQEILKAYNLGIVKGVSNNQFAPYNNITRQEICVMLVRCIDVAIDGADINNFNNNNFADKNKISDWAIDCVNYAFDNGIMKGVGNNCIDPLGNATCEQSILLAYRIYDNQSSLLSNFEEISEDDAKKISNLIRETNILDKENAKQEDVIDFLENVDWVENVAETPDGGVSCRTDFGVTCVWTPYNENKIGGSSAVNATSLSSAIKSTNTYDVDNIVVLCPYASTDSNFNLDGYDYIGGLMEDYLGSSITFLKDKEVSLETLKNLDKYDMVWFYSHGALSNVTNSAWAILDSDPYTMTGEFADSINKYVWLSEDFFYGRTVVNLSDGRIGVGGNFYKHYYSENELDNTFFHFASCNSMRTDKLANGILSRGAEWVQGWTDSVTFNNDYMQFMGVIAHLLDGKTVQESINNANAMVRDEYDFWQENCRLTGLGNSNYKIVDCQDSELLANFSFENTVSDSANSVQIHGNGDYSFENGINGKCIYLDGDGDYLDLGNDYQLPGNFTFNAWVKSESENRSDAAIFAKYETNGYGPYDFYLSYNRPAFWVSNGYGGNDEYISKTTLSSNRWYMITYVKNGDNLKIYVNGKLDLSVECDDITTNNDTVTIGRQSLMFSPYSNLEYKGYIDELKLFNNVLTEENIKNLYNQYAPKDAFDYQDIIGTSWHGEFTSYLSSHSEKWPVEMSFNITDCDVNGNFIADAYTKSVPGNGYDDLWFKQEMKGKIDLQNGNFEMIGVKVVNSNSRPGSYFVPDPQFVGNITSNKISGVFDNVFEFEFNKIEK